jgi:protein SCO1/2
MKESVIPPALRPAAIFLMPDAETVRRATAALGFNFTYDPEIDQFAHPAVVYVLSSAGVVRGTFAPMRMEPDEIKRALGAAVSERPALYERIRLLCYAYDPVTGVYTPRIDFILKIAAAATLALLGGGIILLHRSGARTR